MTSSNLAPLLWFVAIIVIIPVALWLLKRTPIGGGSSAGVMRTVAAMPLSPNQRLLTVEVGHGAERRWLVLGVTGQSITTLHTMEPQEDAIDRPTLPSSVPPFAQLFSRLRGDQGSHRGE